MTRRVLILGCGYAGSAMARRARANGCEVLAVVRSDSHARALEQAGFQVLQMPALDPRVTAQVKAGAHVVVAFAPDGTTDAELAPSLSHAHAITYISSTGVYGERTGPIDDGTPLPAVPSERAARILAAEAQYRAQGATVLRCPGIYGPDRGLHMRMLRGEHRIPGDGSRTLSRIHIHDLAAFVLAAGETRGETFVVGDLAPAPHIEVVRFVCDAYGLPIPPNVPWDAVHETLRADRHVDPSRALTRLGVTLSFPTFREGMAPSATGESVRNALA